MTEYLNLRVHPARHGMRATVLGAVTAALLATPAAAQITDSEHGRALYENHCIACHTLQVHSRPNRIALTRDEVREIVDHWSRQQNLRWSERDIADVVEFLGRTRYRFPADEQTSQPTLSRECGFMHSGGQTKGAEGGCRCAGSTGPADAQQLLFAVHVKMRGSLLVVRNHRPAGVAHRPRRRSFTSSTFQ